MGERLTHGGSSRGGHQLKRGPQGNVRRGNSREREYGAVIGLYYLECGEEGRTSMRRLVN